MPLLRKTVGPGAMLLALACARPAEPPAPAPAAALAAPESTTASSPLLPAVPVREGPLDIRVVYPVAHGVVAADDSSFMFGSVGTGDATLTINGQPVRVWANGAWLAWVPLPADSLMAFRLVARTGADSAVLVHRALRAPRFTPPAAGPWIDTTTLQPAEPVWTPRDEWLPLEVRAAPGAEVRLRLPDGTVIPFSAQPRLAEVPWGIRAFDRDTGHLRRAVRDDVHVGLLRGRAVGPSEPILPGAREAPLAAIDSAAPAGRHTQGDADSTARTSEVDSATAPVLEVIAAGDTARTPWPLRVGLLDSVPLVVELDDAIAATAPTDSVVIGRALPGATYHWFWPTGTRAAVTGRRGGMLRLRLSERASAWVPLTDARPLPAGRPVPLATVGSVTLTPDSGAVTLRVPLGERVPFRIEEAAEALTLRLYSARGDVNWIRYGASDDSLVSGIVWNQAASDEVTLRIGLTQPVWGWRTRWSGDDLLLEIRRPPVLEAGAPLRDLLVAVDPGHPPLGATGPTGFREPEANLAVALELRRLLEEAGARVLMTRVSDSSVDLAPRIRLAEAANAHLLISVHNNALPDGVNPFINHGTSVYYNHLPSFPLARAVQRALVRRLGLRDLGVGRGDLALVRPTWMPAVLTEGLFMMVPDQEAALRSPEGQRLYARAIVDGLTEFLRDRSTR